MARAHKEVGFTSPPLGGSTGDVNTGNIYVRMLPKSDRSIGAEDFGRELRKEVGHIGGATMSVFTNDFQGAQKQISWSCGAVRLSASPSPRSGARCSGASGEAR